MEESHRTFLVCVEVDDGYREKGCQRESHCLPSAPNEGQPLGLCLTIADLYLKPLQNVNNEIVMFRISPANNYTGSSTCYIRWPEYPHQAGMIKHSSMLVPELERATAL